MRKVEHAQKNNFSMCFVILRRLTAQNPTNVGRGYESHPQPLASKIRSLPTELPDLCVDVFVLYEGALLTASR